MKQEEQFKLVFEHIKVVGKGVLEKIETDKLPTAWEARELIQFIADSYKQTTTTMSPERDKAYQEEVKKRNLL